jgi:hypothetical protein
VVAAREDPSLILMPPAPEPKVNPMDSLPPLPNEIPPPLPNEIPPPLTRLNPTNAKLLIPAMAAPAPPTEALQFDEPASLGAGGRDGRARPTRRRGNVVGGGCGSDLAVPMEKDCIDARPVRPRGRGGGTAPGGGDLGWKATRESPRRPRGGGRRSDSPSCGVAIGVRWKREARRCLFVCLHLHTYMKRSLAGTSAGGFDLMKFSFSIWQLGRSARGFHLTKFSLELLDGN